jgi:hypothetical protein
MTDLGKAISKSIELYVEVSVRPWGPYDRAATNANELVVNA